jgi:hypothetical protein
MRPVKSEELKEFLDELDTGDQLACDIVDGFYETLTATPKTNCCTSASTSASSTSGLNAAIETCSASTAT